MVKLWHFIFPVKHLALHNSPAYASAAAVQIDLPAAAETPPQENGMAIEDIEAEAGAASLW